MKTLPILLATLLSGVVCATSTVGAEQPNIVFIFIDDMGYGDIGPFGSTLNKTPHLNRMASEGNILWQFYVSNTACTPSRSALLTGTYAHRIGMDGSVVFPAEKRGLNPDEVTIAELLKKKGYITGCFGKWHLGDQPEFMPLAQGFDEYFGIPYSNDMWPGNKKGHRHTKEPYTPLPIVRQNDAVAYVSDGADQSLLCEVVTDEAVKFIRKHRAEPFFLYLPHAYVHGPRFARENDFQRAEGSINRSAVEEVDTSVGRVLNTLRKLGLDKNTLVIFTSDNGGSRGMSMGPLRGAKGGPKYEGHMRVPTISWWPGTIPAGTATDEIVATIDILPSLAKLVDADLPQDRIIDGQNALNVLLGKPDAKSPHEILYYETDGIRRGKWKLVKGASRRNELYDLDADLGETTNLAAQFPELVQELEGLLKKHAEEIAGNQRPTGMVTKAKPIIDTPGDLPKLREFMGLDDFEVRVSSLWPTRNETDKEATAAPTSKSPNILFIAIDDMNDWSTLFDPDNPIQTPNLRRLADRGCFFTRAYCASPGCNPSRTAIMTGLRPTTSGVYANGNPWRKILPDAVTLPKYFAKHGGYATRGAGKIFHHGRTGAEDPNNLSFQEFFKKLAIRAPAKNYNGYTIEDEPHLGKTAFDWGEHDQKMIDVDMVEWIEQRMDESWDRPLFLAAGIFNPHLPFYAPPENFTRYPLEQTAMPPMPAGDLDDVGEIARQMAHKEYWVYDNTILKEPGSTGSLQRMVQCYQAAADYADQMVGRLLDKLDASGRTDNTIIVLWSDHGYHLGDKESCVKFTLWEKANRVPFIVVAPGVTTPGSRCDRPVSLIDIYPTLVDLAGLPPKADNDGQSLVPLLQKPGRKWPRPALMTEGRGNHAIRSDRWRYIHYSDGSDELYDHDKDPWEWTNLVGDPQYAEVIASHQKWLPKHEAKAGVATARWMKKSQATTEGPKRGVAETVDYSPAPDDILIADFEADSYGDWKTTGTAFGDRPTLAKTSPPPNKVNGHLGKGLVNTYLGRDKSVGTLTSSPFNIDRKHINFLIGGGNHEGATCINLLVDGKVVRTAVGPAVKDRRGREVMAWKSWDVSEFAGRKAVVQIVDSHSGGWGHINIDHIFQSQTPLVSKIKLLDAATAQERSPREVASKVPQFTFATTLEEQEKQLEANPFLLRMQASRAAMAADPHRPIYHYVNPKGKLNDPNGLCYWQGRWHLFYQAYPPEDPRQHWGHAVSDDLIHWRDLPLAIYPDPEEKCFSGSCYVDDNRVIAIYHGIGRGTMVAVSNDPLLLNWEKVTGDAVIPFAKPGEAPLPYNIFDPCLWKRGDYYYALTAGQLPDGPAGKPVRAEFLHRSKDLKEWEYLHPFLENDDYGMVGDDGACPYFWPIGDQEKHILLHFSHMSGGKYLLGDYDLNRHKFVVTDGGDFNHGPVAPGGVHAPSAYPDGKGGVIAIFNMNPGMNTEGWNQIMSLPRRLTLSEEGKLKIEPTGDFKSLRKNHQHVESQILPANKEIIFEHIQGNAMELIAELYAGSSSMIELNVLRSPNKEEVTRILYNHKTGYRFREGMRALRGPWKEHNAITIDTSRSTTLLNVRTRLPETAHFRSEAGKSVQLHVFIDKSIVEVFVDGKQCAAVRVYPGLEESVGVSLRAQGGDAVLKSLDAWQMKNIYE